MLDMVPIDYGIPTDKEALQLRLGRELGFFADEGIDLNIKVVFGGPEIARQFDEGILKIGEMGSPPALVALEKGYRFSIVASSIRQRALQYLVTRPEIHDVSQLAGKRVAALSIGSCSYWFLRQVLMHHGLNPDHDVSIVGLGESYPKVVELFLSGELAGAVISEPNVSIGEECEAFAIRESLTSAEFSPTMQWSVIVANREFAQADPDVLRAVLRGCFRSYRHSVEHPDDIIAFGAHYFGTTENAMRRSLQRESGGLCVNGEISDRALEDAIHLQMRLGAIRSRPIINDIVNRHFLAP
jgi:ABC-type nitrate/sulfonate/bicarbonate transport system substrate-binding protein